MFQHLFGLFTDPQREWLNIRQKIEERTCNYLLLVLVLGLVPPISGFIGTTVFGWKIGAGAPVMMTVASAFKIAVVYYFAIVAGILIVGKAIHWMGQTYDATTGFPESVALAAFVAVPVLLVGLFEIYPILWLNLLIGLVALAYSVRLLYTGLPIMMGVSKEHGFLYSSAILGFGMVALVAMLVVTALLWGQGWAPQFGQA